MLTSLPNPNPQHSLDLVLFFSHKLYYISFPCFLSKIYIISFHNFAFSLPFSSKQLTAYTTTTTIYDSIACLPQSRQCSRTGTGHTHTKTKKPAALLLYSLSIYRYVVIHRGQKCFLHSSYSYIPLLFLYSYALFLLTLTPTYV